MGGQPGIITYTDRGQNQQTVESDGLSGFFNEMGISRQRELRNWISDVFVTASGNRSQFFMSFPVKEWSMHGTPVRYMPVYGVKGESPGLTRSTNYAEIFLCSEEKLMGTGFDERVFGTKYLSGRETVELPASRLLESLEWKPEKKPDYCIPEEYREEVCRIVEIICLISEQYPNCRIVIRLPESFGFYMEQENHAGDLLDNRDSELSLHDGKGLENEYTDEVGFDNKNETVDEGGIGEIGSGWKGITHLDLLRWVYMLLPVRLKLQMGFETNISSEDMKQIQRKDGIPLYVFTMKEGESINPNNYQFPVAVYEWKERLGYHYNKKRMDLLRRLAANMGEKMAVRLDYAEKAIIERSKATFSSFRLYEEILEYVNSDVLLWWERNDYQKVEDLMDASKKQAEFMKFPEYKAESLRRVRDNIYPLVEEQVCEIIADESYPDRNRILQFLGKELGLQDKLNPLVTMSKCMREDNSKKCESLNKELEARHSQELSEKEAEISRLRDEKTNLDNTLQQKQFEYNQLVGQYKALLSQKDQKDVFENEQPSITKKMEVCFKIAIGFLAIVTLVMTFLYLFQGWRLSGLQEDYNKLNNSIKTKELEMKNIEKNASDMNYLNEMYKKILEDNGIETEEFWNAEIDRQDVRQKEVEGHPDDRSEVDNHAAETEDANLSETETASEDDNRDSGDDDASSDGKDSEIDWEAEMGDVG